MKLSAYIEQLQALLARAGDTDVVTVQVHHPSATYAPAPLADTFEPKVVSLIRLDQETSKLLAGTFWSAAEWETIRDISHGGAAPAHTVVTAAVVGDLEPL